MCASLARPRAADEDTFAAEAIFALQRDCWTAVDDFCDNPGDDAKNDVSH